MGKEEKEPTVEELQQNLEELKNLIKTTTTLTIVVSDYGMMDLSLSKPIPQLSEATKKQLTNSLAYIISQLQASPPEKPKE